MLRKLTFVLSLAVCAFVLVAARQRTVRIAVPTFNREIVRILQQNCQSCHREGDIAPFALQTYADARPRAHSIKRMTASRQMPPWKADDECAKFRGARRLSDADIATLARWAEGGAPEGDPRDLPPPVEFSAQWPLGPPDLELKMPAPYVPAARTDTYRCFSIPAGNAKSLAVGAFDTRPGNRSSVHHVIAFIDSTGESERLDAAEAGEGYTCFGGPGFPATGSLGGWAPGMRAEHLPDGIATELPANARVVLQVHYHAHAEAPQADQTAVAIYLSRKPVQKWLRILPLVNNTFNIPAGANAHPVTAVMQLPSFLSVQLWQIAPHMHLLGKSMRVQAMRPDGSMQCLVNIPEWDFNWQSLYTYQQPVAIPGGTLLTLDAVYDNSSANPRNPNNPPKDVRWGEATTDEMCLAFLGFTIDGENVSQGETADVEWLRQLWAGVR